MAILLALASPEEIEILAITTVAGNVRWRAPPATPAQHRGAGRPQRCRSTPAARGRSCAPLETAEYVHGETGLNGAVLPEPAVPLAARPRGRRDRRRDDGRPPGTVTLCPIGPLTNVALAIIKEPAIVPRLKEIVLMGGAMELGNVTAAAEFNIYVDPHAARVVFEAARRS